MTKQKFKEDKAYQMLENANVGDNLSVPKQKKKMKDTVWNIAYHITTGAALITMNIYFFIFVHYKYDLAPNLALAVCTLPLAIWSFIRAFKKEKK